LTAEEVTLNITLDNIT